ncbi:hypothetical protein [Leucobacter sp. OH1287]|uniref:hypothetical protein n=1 Tax=Leucobacter sp. OH1287 TaxID=2491049 RepID=UPI000FBE6889|nr:hypothetical protein [Leucobacter sp. OH1287]RRD59961.1 hypothetical protein EII30_07480 [Leucobacter sp. OH1287]
MPDVWVGRIRVSWLIDLIHHLEVNPRSRVYQLALDDGVTPVRWDQTQTMLADIFDLVAAVNQAETKDKKPVKYPRPGVSLVRDRDGDGRDPRLFAKTIADFDVDAWNQLL